MTDHGGPEFYEERIATDASTIRGDATKLTPELFLKLWPLLCRPIPPEYVQTVPAVTGKPYESTGIRSVQVQIDRMNNVLTPLWWGWVDEYEQQGKLCRVTVWIGNPTDAEILLQSWQDDKPIYRSGGLIVARSSYGGVDRGSTVGNVYKGSFTNAAKRAFAALGPGHEIYLGTADLDPDVSEDAARGGEKGGGRDLAAKLYKRADDLGLEDRLQLAASHVVGADVGDCSTASKAVKALSKLSVAEMEKLDAWLQRKADEAASKG